MVQNYSYDFNALTTEINIKQAKQEIHIALECKNESYFKD